MLLGFDASVDLEAVLEDEADDAFAETFWSSRRRAFGMYAVRGSSLPFDAIFGVPIWRERSIPVFSSMRSSASSIHRVIACQPWNVLEYVLNAPVIYVLKSGSFIHLDLIVELNTQSNTSDGFPATPRKVSVSQTQLTQQSTKQIHSPLSLSSLGPLTAVGT